VTRQALSPNAAYFFQPGFSGQVRASCGAANPARRPAFQPVEPPEKAAASTIGRPTKKRMRYWGACACPSVFQRGQRNDNAEGTRQSTPVFIKSLAGWRLQPTKALFQQSAHIWILAPGLCRGKPIGQRLS
jgi:hypothetical protein